MSVKKLTSSRIRKRFARKIRMSRSIPRFFRAKMLAALTCYCRGRLSCEVGNLDERQDGFVAGMFALEPQEVVETAAGRVGELPAGLRPRVVRLAAARFEIEKVAGASEHRVGLSAEHAPLTLRLRVAALRRLVVNAEMLCEPLDVASFDIDYVVNGAAVGRALRAVEVPSLGRLPF